MLDCRQVHDDDQEVVFLLAVANKTQNRLFAIVGIDDLEAFRFVFGFPKRPFFPVQFIQRCSKMLHFSIQFVFQISERKSFIISPFKILSPFASHKQELFTRMSHLIGIKRAQLGQLAIAIAPHLVHQALLAVHDLVMRQRQNEIFGHPIHP